MYFAAKKCTQAVNGGITPKHNSKTLVLYVYSLNEKKKKSTCITSKYGSKFKHGGMDA